MIYIRKLFTQDLRDGKQIAFPKEPSYDFFKFDYQNNEADRHIEFIFEPENSTFKQFEGKKIETRLYAAGSESRIDGELKAFIRDEIKIEVDDLVVFKSDGRTNNKFKFDVILKNYNEYPLYMKIIDSANHTLIESELKKQALRIIDKPFNRIIFGAPGTGKSHKLNDESFDFGKNIERVTFHPNYSYAQFVGIYKPITKFNTNTNEENISYEYVPGPFIRTLIAAKKNRMPNLTDKRVFIITNNRNTSGWDYYKEVSGPGFVEEWWNPHSKARIDDIVLLYLGKSYDKTGVFAVGTIISDAYDAADGKRIKIRFDYTSFNEPFFTDEIINENVPNRRIESWIDETEHGKLLISKMFLNCNYLLLIEEINRANVAAVFGDIFQLLDRDDQGNSVYPITTSEDLRKFLAKPENLGGTPDDYKTLSIPSNMYIWATMNSADQGVFPMDTAFKRRWEFEYIGIDENEKEVENFYIPINNNKKVKWNELRMAINDKLIELGINEDKLLGPFFMNKTVLENAMNKDSNFIKSFESKVLMYLFEDATKMKVRQLFNLPNDKYIYSEICKKFENDGLAVFKLMEDSKVVIEDVEAASQSANETLF